ncbi:hypothetical protein BCR34DRAFT_57234 [Clohesyomyces aquaticus]|uniref:Uncharacterized protein n=1 Tax=Clohesyomyces aquaticus TaxID=1231657 RepID=A0A1Y1Z272_9PLEO|nr:hypothetical protein BCR34DRAFT_57234 [Clohesyomyces aquaticus]
MGFLTLVTLISAIVFSFLPLAAYCDSGHAADNPFAANLAKRIDPNDEQLKEVLWEGYRDLSYINRTRKAQVITYSLGTKHQKRRTRGTPLISVPSCLDCASKSRTNSSEIGYDDFTAAKMVNLIVPGGKTGSCLFYGQRDKDMDPRSLSASATTLGCLWPLSPSPVRAIWNMWPQDDTRNTDYGLNYYCLDAWAPKPCWLNNLMPGPDVTVREPKTRPYFQQMSAAMALTCQGTIYVLHDRPDNLLYEPIGQPTSIWITHELPVLKRLFKQGVVSGLKVIPTIGGPTGRGLPNYDPTTWLDKTEILRQPLKRDIEWTEEMAQFLKARVEQLRSQELSGENGTEHISAEERRGLCSGSAARQENSHLDYFG